MKLTTDKVCWMFAALILILAVWSGNAKAEAAILLGGWSDHPISEAEYNEDHKATLIEYGSYMAGRFHNSYGRNTWAAAYGFSKQWGDWRGSVHVGAMYGYRSCYGDDGDSATICPMAYPALTYTAYPVQPQVGLLGEAVVFIVRVAL